MRKLAVTLALVAGLTGPVAAGSNEACGLPEGVKFTTRDIARLEGLEVSRSIGLAQALRAESAADRELIASLFEKGFEPIGSAAEIIGKYQCRTIKLGGLGPAVVYGWFSCEINPEDAALTIFKSTGSQRFFGLLYPAGTGLTYRGAGHYGYETEFNFYGDEADRDQVGCLSKIAGEPGHLVLELPEPVFESAHNVIELKRRN